MSPSFEVRDPSAVDLTVGHIEAPGAVTLRAVSYVRWTVQVRALESSLSRSHDGRSVKPLDSFLLRTDGEDYFPIDTRDQTLASGSNGTFDLTVDYRVKADAETHRDGDYALTVIYTIAADWRSLSSASDSDDPPCGGTRTRAVVTPSRRG